MPAKNQRTTGEYRWSESGTEVLHAYPWSWNPDKPQTCAPACGGQAPRKKLGRGMAPPVGAPVCGSCALKIGFVRRPRTSRAWALRRAKLQEQRTTVDAGQLGRIEAQGEALAGEVADLRLLVLRLLRHLMGSEVAEPGARAVMDGEPASDG